MSFMEKLFGNFSDKELKRIKPIANKVLELEPEMQKLTDEELQAKTPYLKEKLKNGASLDDILPEAFAVCREADWRVLGLKPYPVQIIGGIVLHRSCIAEMQTGEGKTLVATMPVYLNALTGEGVHVVTVNDYLAKRDSEWMGKVYRFLGLTVGLVIHDVQPQDRRKAYLADVTYGTNNEFGFDYLRDNMVVYKASMVQRGHAYAIVDEVDSILIDEARTPLIISGKGEDSSVMYKRADDFAKTLKKSVIVELDDKVEADEQVDGDYVVDEKHKTCTLTESGVKKAEAWFNVENLADADNMTLRHYIDGAIKARGVMHRDTDYIVKDGEVIIVDEFTGRLMYGRRFNDGLHQAIEAKEGVTVAAESKTLASITFQNYFRMYKKLAGMTGTAKTEEQEFQSIYDLDVVEVPTNKPLRRVDNNDVVYTTEAGKLRAVVEEIAAVHKTGQPILVGTISVEKSELLSDMLKRRGIDHVVLNAKQHAREAEIVAQAGKLGSVTIATNMAGRGTDILLGGNPEFLARRDLLNQGMAPELLEEATGHAETADAAVLEARAQYGEAYARHKQDTDREHDQVVAVGGLHILGTERHESRRIDNQLRGRAGRQGDPGSTRFYLSMEDDLMQRFGGERVKSLMERISPEDDIPIEVGLLTKQIESAQKRVEAYNFDIRKNVLQYDDVMNRQREIIYGQRRKVLMGEDIRDNIQEMVKECVQIRCAQFCPSALPAAEWDKTGLRSDFLQLTGLDCQDTIKDITDADQLEAAMEELAAQGYEKKEQDILKAAQEMGGAADMREIERVLLLRAVDEHWMDHIDAMDQLRQGIGLQALGQKDPVVAYRNAGFDMFDEMVRGIREKTVRSLYHVALTTGAPKREQLAKPIETAGDGSMPRQPARAGAKIGRNDPCPCGSGKKYKNCCGRDK